MAHAFEGFKKRKETVFESEDAWQDSSYYLPVLVLLLLFPSEAQLEANAVVKEKEIIEEMKKEVQDLIEKETFPIVEKRITRAG